MRQNSGDEQSRERDKRGSVQTSSKKSRTLSFFFSSYFSSYFWPSLPIFVFLLSSKSFRTPSVHCALPSAKISERSKALTDQS